MNDNCQHIWETITDSQYHNEHTEEIRCSKCGEIGQRDIQTGEIYWPTT